MLGAHRKATHGRSFTPCEPWRRSWAAGVHGAGTLFACLRAMNSPVVTSGGVLPGRAVDERRVRVILADEVSSTLRCYLAACDVRLGTDLACGGPRQLLASSAAYRMRVRRMLLRATADTTGASAPPRPALNGLLLVRCVRWSCARACGVWC
eukprot:1776192-Rhodomonas_salina.4